MYFAVRGKTNRWESATYTVVFGAVIYSVHRRRLIAHPIDYPVYTGRANLLRAPPLNWEVFNGCQRPKVEPTGTNPCEKEKANSCVDNQLLKE